MDLEFLPLLCLFRGLVLTTQNGKSWQAKTIDELSTADANHCITDDVCKEMARDLGSVRFRLHSAASSASASGEPTVHGLSEGAAAWGYLRVLCGDLQQQCQGVEIEGLVQGYKSPVYATL